MTKILVFVFCLVLIFPLLAQKKLKDSIIVLNLRNDSLTYKLAEARREWMKCSENFIEQKNSLNASLRDIQMKGMGCEENLRISVMRFDSLIKIYEQTVEISKSVQKQLAEIDASASIKSAKAKELILKLKDSISDIDMSLWSISNYSEKVNLIISDTLLLNGKQYLTEEGKLFLGKICSTLISQADWNLTVKVFAGPDTRKKEVWRHCNIKTAVILNGLQSFDFPEERLSLHSIGYWRKSDYKIPPIILEMQQKNTNINYQNQ